MAHSKTRAFGRITGTAVSRIVAVALLGLAACGGSGGGGGDDEQEELARIAVGTRSDEDGVQRGLILRNGGDGWVPVAEELLDERLLAKVTFASHDAAWAYGHGLLRSRDAGRTWEAAEAALLPQLGGGTFVIRGLAFASATTGYLAAYRTELPGRPVDGPYVWVTRDGGESWTVVEGVELRPQEDAFGFVVAVRAGVPEIFRHAPAATPGAVIETLDDGHVAQTVATGTVAIANGFDTVGERGWIAFGQAADDDPASSRPTILSSERPGAPWTAQAIADAPAGGLASLDMCDAQVGLTGGALQDGDILGPVAFYTDDGGVEWHRSTLPRAIEQFIVYDVLCVAPGEMLMAGYTVSTSGAGEILESADGGRTFTRTALPVQEQVVISGLATNAALP